MQPQENITFYCHSCGIKLLVPFNMAGVSGPCPQCSAKITAPSEKVKEPPVESVPQPAERQNEAPLQQAQKPRQQDLAPTEERTRNRVEQSQPQPQPQPQPQKGWVRLAFPLLFLLVITVIVLAVLHALGVINLLNYIPKGKDSPAANNSEPVENIAVPDTSKETSTDTPSPPSEPAVPPEAEPAVTPETDSKKENSHADGEFPELELPPSPTESSDTESKTLPLAKTSQDESPPKAGFPVNDILDQFLMAQTLEERQAFMLKSSRTHEQLMDSCLAKPLKPVKAAIMLQVSGSKQNNIKQYLYKVSFEGEGGTREHVFLQVVERPGNHPPLINADAFIEHYDKEMVKYAEQPSSDVFTFHCVAEARTADFAKGIPQELKNKVVRMVIKNNQFGNPLFDAYLNKNSPLMSRIGGTNDFPYVEQRLCILSFRWNTKYPGQPFIELDDIVALGWEK